MRMCGYGRVEEINLLRDLNVGRIFMDSEISKSSDSSVGENYSEPSPDIKEGGLVTLGNDS